MVLRASFSCPDVDLQERLCGTSHVDAYGCLPLLAVAGTDDAVRLVGELLLIIARAGDEIQQGKHATDGQAASRSCLQEDIDEVEHAVLEVSGPSLSVGVLVLVSMCSRASGAAPHP
jgi:hypothetical protein